MPGIDKEAEGTGKKEGVIGANTEKRGKVEDNHKNACFPQVVCLACGYLWRPKVANPKSCPKCKQYIKVRT